MSDTVDRELPTYRLGYAIERESKPLLMSQGFEPREMLRRIQSNGLLPVIDTNAHPTALFDPLNQGEQGACQGHSLAIIFTICFWLLTGRVKFFSRAAAYYLSQLKDGITTDMGSTLSAGQWVATQHGLCLEDVWPYPKRYNPAKPAGISFPFKLVASQPTQDIELIREALDIGLPVQDGIIWDDSVSRTICTNYRGQGGGGHSTALWMKKSQNYMRINSWGMWDGDGCNENTPEALKQQVEHRFSSHIIYAPENMLFPELAPVELPE